jgi:hypothetical protein
MNKLQKIIIFSFVLCFGLMNVFAQAGASNIVRKDLSQAEIDKIIKNIAFKEGEFREALKNYVFNRSAVVQTVGLGGQVTGEFRRDSFLTFNSDGARFEKVLFAPITTIQEITITPEDIENLGGIDPFAIEPHLIDQYSFNYIGKEKIDELELYVFDVSPKLIPDYKKSNQRFFSGRIWVDDRDLQIVKSKGKAVPEGKQRYPIVETWRENIDGKYWFPAYSLSTGRDGELVFDNGQVARIKLRVKYSDYRQGRSEVKILDDVEEEPKTKPTPTPTPTLMPNH